MIKIVNSELRIMWSLMVLKHKIKNILIKYHQWSSQTPCLKYKFNLSVPIYFYKSTISIGLICIDYFTGFTIPWLKIIIRKSSY